eukprot:NODE_79_length_23048_cov_0.747614.p16 type:complete len:130 gc:universal NODE_79_length_23048_cov_0.747614:4976-5365(+)
MFQFKRFHTHDILQLSHKLLPRHNPKVMHNDSEIDLKYFMEKIRSGSVIKINFDSEDFTGVMIQKRKKGIDSSIHLRQPNYHSTAVERMFKVHSPKLSLITVIKEAKWARRARLYYLRDHPTKAKSGYK